MDSYFPSLVLMKFHEGSMEAQKLVVNPCSVDGLNFRFCICLEDCTVGLRILATGFAVCFCIFAPGFGPFRIGRLQTK